MAMPVHAASPFSTSPFAIPFHGHVIESGIRLVVPTIRGYFWVLVHWRK